MRKILNKLILQPCNFLFFPEWMKKQTINNSVTIFKRGFVQKIFRINSHVTWPVHPTTMVNRADKINPGSRAPGLSISCYLDGRNGIEFGNNVWVGPRVSIISMNHDLNDYSKFIQGKPIIIGDDCLLTANCVILPEVELGPNTVVAAGAVVSNSFPEGNVVLAGVPAKVIKRL